MYGGNMPITATNEGLKKRSLCTLGSKFTAALILAITAIAQAQDVAGQSDPTRNMVELTLPPEMELKTLIDFVSQKLNVKLLYDEKVLGNRISVKAPQPVPEDTLMDVLQSALKMKGFALLDADVKGWKKIVKVDDLPRIATPGEDRPIEDFSGAEAVTQAFQLLHMTPEKASALIKPFLSQQGANDIAIPERNLLIVTDYAINLQRIAKLIETIDQAGPEREIRFYQAKNLMVADLAKQLTAIQASQPATSLDGGRPVALSYDERTNQLLVIGTPSQVNDTERLAEALDVSLKQTTEIYSFRFIEATRVEKLAKDMLDPLVTKRFFRSAVDREDNLLIVTGTDEIHEKIRWIQDRMDIESKGSESGLKVYKLKYADAQDVLNILRGVTSSTSNQLAGVRRGVSPMGRGGGSAPSSLSTLAPPNGSILDTGTVPTPTNQAVAPSPDSALQQGYPPNMLEPNSLSAFPLTIIRGGGDISIDPNSNSLIVIADRNVQALYAELIKELDRRRPQVMLEAKIVIIDTSDNFQLGVELSGGDRSGLGKLLQFTSYGLSTVNATTGSLSLIPGRGFNWTLVDPRVAEAVIRSLVQHNRAQVLSAPRILVNDNATGTLASVTEVPFASINASNTVATTSFAGFAEAGTTIEAKPRITDEDHLHLSFTISLNSFLSGAGETGVPPRQTDQMESEVTIPDGYTIIAGGLTRRNQSRSRDAVPFLEYIPILRELTSTYSEARSQSTLFVFLRPVILRDDKFNDLKYLSDMSLSKTPESGNCPDSCPILIK